MTRKALTVISSGSWGGTKCGHPLSAYEESWNIVARSSASSTETSCDCQLLLYFPKSGRTPYLVLEEVGVVKLLQGDDSDTHLLPGRWIINSE